MRIRLTRGSLSCEKALTAPGSRENPGTHSSGNYFKLDRAGVRQIFTQEDVRGKEGR